MARLLLLIPSRFYRTREFVTAAHGIGVEVTIGSDRPQVFAADSNGAIVTLDFQCISRFLRQVIDFSVSYSLTAVIGVDDQTAILAAEAAQALGLPHDDPVSVRTAADKFRFRQTMQKAGLATPPFRLVTPDTDPADISTSLNYPCVLKPLNLSGSRGVIRADDPVTFGQAFYRIARILQGLGSAKTEHSMLVEDYLPGPEIVLEGLMRAGELQVLAIFDKPDPLTGPVFEETIYVTPSRLSAETQQRITHTVQMAARALPLLSGPIHAELRMTPGPVVIELAPRSIGGLCARALTLATGIDLQRLIIASALGQPSPIPSGPPVPAGVMMIPTPRPGVLRVVHGLEAARAVDGIEDIVITIPPGDRLIPLPEGNRYPGFIFARGGTPRSVEHSLRAAHQCLDFELDSR